MRILWGNWATKGAMRRVRLFMWALEFLSVLSPEASSRIRRVVVSAGHQGGAPLAYVFQYSQDSTSLFPLQPQVAFLPEPLCLAIAESVFECGCAGKWRHAVFSRYTAGRKRCYSAGLAQLGWWFRLAVVQQRIVWNLEWIAFVSWHGPFPPSGGVRPLF